MATTSNVTVIVTYSVDTIATETYSASTNAASPGSIKLVTLASGDNTITLPTGGSTVTGCLVIPPSGNTNALSFKKTGADSGSPLHLTNPLFLTFAAGYVSFVLNSTGTTTGVRLIWA